MDKRRLELHTVRRLAWWEPMVGLRGLAVGPVVELELGDRAASYFLHAPSSGTWRDLWMSK